MTSVVRKAPSATVRPSRGFRLPARLPLPLAGLGVVLLVMAVRQRGALRDPDTWWHLRAGDGFASGEWSLRSPGWPTPVAREPWVARDWLPQVVASEVVDRVGPAGVAWLAGAAILATLVATWFAARQVADPMVSAIAVVVVAVGTAGGHSARPQLVSFVLLAVFVGAWLGTLRDGRPRWSLVPLTALWACSHGLWVVGVVLSVVVIVGMALDGTRPRSLLRLAMVPLAGTTLAILTPAGPAVLSAALQGNPARGYVQEWLPASLLDSPTAVVTVLAVGVTVTCYARAGDVRWSMLGLLALGAGFTILSARTVAVGAIIVAPLLADALQRVLGERPRPRERRESVAVAVVLLTALLVMVPAVSRVGVDAERFPLSMGRTLDSLPAGTVLLNQHELGGWLEWRHRHVRVVVDGNMPAYGPDYQLSYIHALGLQPGWQSFVDESGAEYALLAGTTPLASALELVGWRRLETDGVFVLLQAP